MRYATLFCFIFLSIYVSTYYIVQVPYTRSYYMSTFNTMCAMYDNPFDVARYSVTSAFSTTHTDFFPYECNQVAPPPTNRFGSWQMKQRPIVGDHIHLLYKMRLHNHTVIFHDRNLTEIIPYEQPPATCTESYAYTKLFYHTGVHSHCDSTPNATNPAGVIHVHPWSAPTKLRVEGREVTLGMFFESIGVEQTPRGFQIHGETYRLNMAYYSDANKTTYDLLTHDMREIMNLWLVDCHGAVLLWDTTSDMPSITEKDRVFLQGFACHPENYPKRLH